jgi:hypothetical protein
MFEKTEDDQRVENKALFWPLSVSLSGCQATQRAKVPYTRLRVIETALHLPAAHVELAVGPAVETGPVGLTLARKRPAHLSVPTTQ